MPTKHNGFVHAPCKREVAGSRPAVGSMPAQHDGWCTRLVSARREFEPPRWLHGDVAHLVEHLSCKQEAVGSSPTFSTHARVAQMVGGVWLRPRAVHVRIVSRVRMSCRSSLEWTPPCQGGDRRFKSGTGRIGRMAERSKASPC